LIAALKHVRPIANPNHSFMEQLVEYAASPYRAAAAAELSTTQPQQLTPMHAPGIMPTPVQGDGKRSCVSQAADEAYVLQLTDGSNPDASMAALHTRTVMWVHEGKQYLVDETTTDIFTLQGKHVGKRRLDPASPIDYAAAPPANYSGACIETGI
jgi:hypothetical protein